MWQPQKNFVCFLFLVGQPRLNGPGKTETKDKEQSCFALNRKQNKKELFFGQKSHLGSWTGSGAASPSRSRSRGRSRSRFRLQGEVLPRPWMTKSPTTIKTKTWSLSGPVKRSNRQDKATEKRSRNTVLMWRRRTRTTTTGPGPTRSSTTAQTSP